MHLFVCAAFLLMGAAPADSVVDCIPDTWRERAQLEMSRESSRDHDFKNARLDEGIAQLVLGPFETLDFIRSDETDPRGTARLRSAKFEIVRGDSCAGTVEVYEPNPRFPDSFYPNMLLGKFAPCRNRSVEAARALARSRGSICELILPLESSAWRIILIDTKDRGTLVMEIPSMPGVEVDSAAVTITPLADWSAHARKSLREWLRLDKPLPLASHVVPEDATREAQAWLKSRYALSTLPVPALDMPIREFVLSKLELARFAESNESDPVRFDANSRFLFPVEGRKNFYVVVERNCDEFGRRIFDLEGEFRVTSVAFGGGAGDSMIEPRDFVEYGHAAILNMGPLGLLYHMLGPHGATIGSKTSWSGPRSPVATEAFADSMKSVIRQRLQQ